MRLTISAIVDASKIAAAVNGYRKALDAAVMETGLLVERDTKRIMTSGYVPDIVDTGRLRASIHVERAGSAVQLNGATVYGRNYNYKNDKGESFEGTMEVEIGPEEVIVGTNVEYAPYHEFGTRKMAARPYLGPAFARNRDTLKRRVAHHAKRVAP